MILVIPVKSFIDYINTNSKRTLRHFAALFINWKIMQHIKTIVDSESFGSKYLISFPFPCTQVLGHFKLSRNTMIIRTRDVHSALIIILYEG